MVGTTTSFGFEELAVFQNKNIENDNLNLNHWPIMSTFSNLL